MLLQKGEKYVWMAIFIGGDLVAAVLGIAIQTLMIPSLLYRRKGIHVVELFHFMFGQLNLYSVRDQRNPQVAHEEIEESRLRAPPTTFLSIRTLITSKNPEEEEKEIPSISSPE